MPTPNQHIPDRKFFVSSKVDQYWSHYITIFYYTEYESGPKLVLEGGVAWSKKLSRTRVYLLGKI